MEFNIKKKGDYFIAFDILDKTRSYGKINIKTEKFIGDTRCLLALRKHLNKKTFKIPVSWEMYGVVNIVASSLEEAKKIALSPNTALPDGSYVDDSFVLDDEEIIKEMNQD